MKHMRAIKRINGIRNRKKLLWWVGIVLILLYFISWAVVRWGEGWIFQYYLKNYPLPDTTIQHSFSLASLVNPDGDTLRGALYGPDDPKAVVLLFRGAGGQADWYNYDESQFKEPHWSVLLTDYRGGGWSRGKYCSEEDFFEDAQAWYDYIVNRFPDRPVIIYGVSLGSGPAAWLAAETQEPLLILQSAYFSWEDQMASIFFWFPYRSLTRFSIRTGDFLSEYDGETVVFHGESDHSIPKDHPQKLVSVNPDRIHLVTVPGKGHETMQHEKVFIETLKVWIQKINRDEPSVKPPFSTPF